MSYKRLISCLDIKKKNVVKGIKFKKIKIVKKPWKLCKSYYKKGVDEIVLLNISKNNILYFSKIIKKTVKNIFIPICAGGNINSIEDVNLLFNSGADKVCLNTSLFKKKLIEEVSYNYGSQCLVASIDVKKKKNKWYVYINGGKKNTNIESLFWVKKCIKRGVGEILLTNIDKDGGQKGFDIKLINYISSNINVPLISSGGGGSDFKNIIDVFYKTESNAILLASSLHSKKIDILNLKSKIKCI
ncbi:imidazole glycerol phosphate synthase subunit HisF [Candidatus Vidania fulgoroideorum]